MNRDGQTPVFDMNNYEKMSQIKAQLDERKRSSLLGSLPTPPTF